MHVFSSAYNEYTVISKEYTGPLDFDITGVNYTSVGFLKSIVLLKLIPTVDTEKIPIFIIRNSMTILYKLKTLLPHSCILIIISIEMEYFQNIQQTNESVETKA